ncbi:hypothetical protein [Acinetobacter sp. TSRC1-2]|uniref:hypothetical protein n=1 Tax=unclassified Acinetobacter TaxID=196816 RepID=UPI003CF205FF
MWFFQNTIRISQKEINPNDKMLSGDEFWGNDQAALSLVDFIHQVKADVLVDDRKTFPTRLADCYLIKVTLLNL